MKPLDDYTLCDLCPTPETLTPATLQGVVGSSEREFENERFTVWQCGNCKTIHAKEGVDLAHYYCHYGLHDQAEPDPITKFFFGRKLKWLETAGMHKQQRVLDYGCGGGQFLRFLREKGYQQAFGYDPFTEEFADKSILEQRYDMVMSSDVIEHDISVMAHLDALISLCTEGGGIYIETPDALSIDLNKIEQHRQILQQPFHRHILPHTWLVTQMRKSGWQVAKMARHPFFHSWIPFLNVPAMDHYWNKYGGLTTLNEGYQWSVLLSPNYWFLGLFGALIYGKDEVQLVFRKNRSE